MKVLLLGATGRTGKHVLDFLLKDGYTVNILVRDKRKIHRHSENLKILEGNTIDKQTLLNAMSDCAAVISVLNINRTTDFPWAKLRTSKTFLSDTMQNILNVAREMHLNRVITCSAWGVYKTKKDIPWWFRWVIDNSKIGITYQEHERQEDLPSHSEMNYTIVRPVGLTNFKTEKQIRVSENNIPKPNLLISRRDTAKFMVQLLKDSSYNKRTITISNN